MTNSNRTQTLVRTLWWLATFWLPLPPRSKGGWQTYRYYDLRREGGLIEKLVSAYQLVFSGAPWFEGPDVHTSELLRRRFQEEIGELDGCLTLTRKNEDVVGFMWALGVWSWQRIAEVFLADHGPELKEGADVLLRDSLKWYLGEARRPIMYIIDLGAVPGQRKGMQTIQSLMGPLLLYFRAASMVYWTTPESKTYNHATILGAQEIWRGQMGKHTVVFFYVPNAAPVLKAFYFFPLGLLQKLVRGAGRTGGLKKDRS